MLENFKKSQSISKINSLSFIFLININIFFYLFNLGDYKIVYLFLNLIILIIFFVLNKKYNHELNEKKNDVKVFSDNILK